MTKTKTNEENDSSVSIEDSNQLEIEKATPIDLKREDSSTSDKVDNNKSNDVITPATVYDYLMMPETNPEKNSWINYLAETRRDTSYKTPYYYLYQKF